MDILSTINKEERTTTVVNKRTKTTKVIEPVRNTIFLRPVKKAYLAGIRRFRVSDNILKVEFRLKNGDTFFTDFIEFEPIASEAKPEVETYLYKEDKETFQFVHRTIGYKESDLDIVIYYDDENRPVFTQEYYHL